MAAKGIKRQHSSVTSPVRAKSRARRKLSPKQRLDARKAHASYKSRRRPNDKFYDLVRSRFRSGRRGRKLKAGGLHPLHKKARNIARRAALLNRIVKKGRGGKIPQAAAGKISALRGKVKGIYAGNRKRLQAVAKQKAHEITGAAILAARKMMAAAKTPEAKAKAKVKVDKLLTAAKNKAVRVVQDARRDLTGLRKLAGRNRNSIRRSAAIHGVKVTPKAGKKKPSVKVNRPQRKSSAAPASAAPAAPSKKKFAPLKFKRPKRKHAPAPKAPKAKKSRTKKAKPSFTTPSQMRKEYSSAMW